MEVVRSWDAGEPGCRVVHVDRDEITKSFVQIIHSVHEHKFMQLSYWLRDKC